jgi:predicted ATPase
MQIPKFKRYVISGAPGSGKTTLINAFKMDDVFCFEEVSRSIIAEAQQSGKAQPFLTDPLLFSNLLLSKRIDQFNHPKQAAFHLYDRGIHDVIAYLEEINAKYPDEFDKKACKYIYDKVFLLPPWEDIYKQDAERYETYQHAVKIHEHLKAVYQKFSMSIVDVPKISVEQRIEFVKSHF